MQLILKRGQRSGGMLSNKIIFTLDARVDLTPEEKDNVKKYKLGPTPIYDSETRKSHSAAVAAHGETVGTGDLGRSLLGFAAGAVRAAAAALSLRITIDSLSAGQHVECKDLNELLGAEAAIRDACQTCKNYLAIASKFDGSEEVIAI
jgi:hypothetical protein